MSAAWFVKKAERTTSMPSRGLRRGNHCVCHPREWGLKKGLRRARRRFGRDLIRNELKQT